MISLRASLVLLAVILSGALAPARADTPAGQVLTQTVGAGQAYPVVPVGGEGWFDVGGFCKVVNVGSASQLPHTAQGQAPDGIPVYTPGSAAQWENWRTIAPTHYQGQLTSTTCCRPQGNIATLCTEAGATPVPVSRQYGKLGETDVVNATCVDQWGRQYTDAVSVSCQGDNGPDGQAQWVETSGDSTSNCTANANITYGGCSQSCSTGGSIGRTYETVQDSCGVVTAQGYIGPECGMQSCCTPSYSKSCSGSTATYTDVSCGTGSYTVGGGCSLQVIGGNECAPAGGCADCNGGNDGNSCGGVTSVCPVGSKACPPGQGCTLPCPTTWHPFGNAGACVENLPCSNPTNNPDGDTLCPCEGWQ